MLTFAEHARAVLYNGLGRYEAALAPAESASRRDELFVSVWSLPELVEAAAHCGEGGMASAGDRASVGANGGGWHGVGAWRAGAVEGVVNGGEVAERLYC